MVDLRRGFRDPATAADARALLEKLRKRRDVYAAIADEIQELLTGATRPSPGEPPARIGQHIKPGVPQVVPPVQPQMVSYPPSSRSKGRIRGAVGGAILGSAVGIALVVAFGPSSSKSDWPWGLLTGAAAAMAGAIGGSHRRTVLFILIGAIVGCIVGVGWAIGAGNDKAFFAGAFYGVPLGAIGGALIDVLLRKMKVFIAAG